MFILDIVLFSYFRYSASFESGENLIMFKLYLSITLYNILLAIYSGTGVVPISYSIKILFEIEESASPTVFKAFKISETVNFFYDF